MKTMADVLAAHQWYDATTDNEDPATGCTGCPEWFGSEDALDDGSFASHQAAALAAAGFGDVREAGAVALEEAAKDLSWLGAQGNLVHPDTAWAGITTCINAIRARAAAVRGEG